MFINDIGGVLAEIQEFSHGLSILERTLARPGQRQQTCQQTYMCLWPLHGETSVEFPGFLLLGVTELQSIMCM